jgi:putative glutamine amidotransferase
MALIGITHCRKLEDYRQSVLHAGAEVRVLETSPDLAGALSGLDGLLLTGGGDVDPMLYGEAPHATIDPAEPGRDQFELGLVTLAREQQLPLLAICRGIQVLNVACGGTLVQDIPSQVPGALSHRLEVPPHQAMEYAHEVWIDKDSQLARLMRERLSDTDACEVNSRHHQAIRQLAPGFVVSATAPDGVIEAIEDQKARFCVGVQWHPENFFRTGEFRPLFEGLMVASGFSPASRTK